MSLLTQGSEGRYPLLEGNSVALITSSQRVCRAAGTRLGNYEIVGPLFAGGMSEVYRATDIKLDRDVALKVLPAAFAQHPERLARFEREAKVLASLDHRNIASIYAVEKSSDGEAL